MLHSCHARNRHFQQNLPYAVRPFNNQRKMGLLIILALANHPLRFSELVRHIGGISERMASQTLKYLERYGVVRRHVVQHATPLRSNTP